VFDIKKIEKVKYRYMTSIRPLVPSDWTSVRDIYREGLATGNANFSSAVPDWEEWDNSHVKSCRLVAIENDLVLGWASLTAISDRCVYAGVAEVSIYVAKKSRGKGIGKELLKALIDQSEKNNFWTLESRIFPENQASINIHEEYGFRIVGSRERIGQMNGVWRDILLLERRSVEIGI
jgi:L-amino acid N-acyltransferase YncA